MRAEIAKLDADTDCDRITQLLATHEFPWGITQALSFALFRTYAVPSIGELLYQTGQFTQQTQKRYDDTVLLLDAPLEHGFDAPLGRAAIRRINQMHAMYRISNDDMRYVLATFVVCPVRWVHDFEWRALSDHEITALTNYYRKLGKHMAIRDIPETFAQFEELMEGYESTHFAFRAQSRAVADATLGLLGTFGPYKALPQAVVRRLSFALMDEPLLTAFGYPAPTPAERLAVGAGLKARGYAIRFARPRREPMFGRQSPTIGSYPGGYLIDQLGTFRAGCPVPHRSGSPARMVDTPVTHSS